MLTTLTSQRRELGLGPGKEDTPIITVTMLEVKGRTSTRQHGTQAFIWWKTRQFEVWGDDSTDKMFPCKHEANAQHPCTKLSWGYMLIIYCWGDRGMLESCWPDSLAQFTCSKFQRDLAQKLRQRVLQEDSQRCPPGFHMCIHMKTHTHKLSETWK